MGEGGGYKGNAVPCPPPPGLMGICSRPSWTPSGDSQKRPSRDSGRSPSSGERMGDKDRVGCAEGERWGETLGQSSQDP